MIRKCERYDLTSFKEALPELENSTVEIYIDSHSTKNKKDVINVLSGAGSKRLRRIFAVILKNEYLDNIYKREDKHITAIKLKSGIAKNQNFRIYCKEFYKNGKKVVLITPHLKKVQKNRDDEKILSIIDSIKKYDYEF